MSYRYVDGVFDLSLLLETAQASDPWLNQAWSDEKYLNALFMAGFEYLSDGEVVIADDEQDRFKTAEERHGEAYAIVSRLGDLASRDTEPPVTDEWNKFARFLGRILAERVLSGDLQVPEESGIINLSKGLNILQIGTEDVAILNSGDVVLDIGPGIVGRRFINPIAYNAAFTRPYQYISISKGPFVNKFLESYYWGRLSRLLAGDIAGIPPYYVQGLENGMADGTASLIYKYQAADKMTVSLMCGIHNATKKDLAMAAHNSETLLRSGGILVVSAPKRRYDETMSTFADMLDIVADNTQLTDAQTLSLITGEASIKRSTIMEVAVFKKI